MVEMRHKITGVALPLLMLALIIVIVFVCGCSEKKPATQDKSPSTAPQETVPQPQSTTPSTQGGTSPSEAALAQAKAEGKPVLLKFGSGKCVPCIEIDKNINAIKPEYEGKAAIIIVDLNDPSEYDFAMEYNIETIPTTIFFKKDGTIAKGYVGVMTPDELRNELNSIL
jgi:thioredoxin-like negative regulator of GroEL